MNTVWLILREPLCHKTSITLISTGHYKVQRMLWEHMYYKINITIIFTNKYKVQIMLWKYLCYKMDTTIIPTTAKANRARQKHKQFFNTKQNIHTAVSTYNTGFMLMVT